MSRRIEQIASACLAFGVVLVTSHTYAQTPSRPAPGSKTAIPAARQIPPAQPQQEVPSVQTHFNAAQTFQIAGDFDKAADEYRKGISVALQQLGNLRVSQGEYKDGIEALRRSAGTDPANLDAEVDLGVAYFRSGDYESARTCVKNVIKVDPGNFRARNLSGKINFMLGDFEAAAADLQEALAITPDFDVAYSLALANLQMKRLPQATPMIDEMKASMGTSPELHALLGQAYQQTGYYDLALSEFKNTLTLDPNYPKLHAYLGATYVAMGGKENFDLARAEFKQQLSKTPNDYGSHYYMGMIEAESGHPVVAESLLQEAHRASPSDAAPLLLLGRVYNQERNWQGAISVLKVALSLLAAPGTAPSQVALAHQMLSDAYKGLGQTPEAEKELALSKTTAAPLSPDALPASSPTKELRALMEKSTKQSSMDKSAQQFVTDVSKLLGNAYNNLGVIDARKSSYVDAAEEFKQAGRWDPSIPQLDRNLALASFRAERYADAIASLERLSHSSPGDQNLRQMLGLSYYMTNQFKESAATFRPMLDELPNNPGLLLSAGISFVRVGDFAAGQKLFARAFETGRGTAEVHLIIGQAYADQDKEQEALAEFRQALELNAVVPEAHYYIGMILFRKGQLDEAIGEFQKELLVNPKNTAAMYQTAYIRMQQHQAPEAAKLLAEVIQQEPSNADAHYQLGKALLEQGDAAGATRELEASVKLHPTDYAYFQLSNAYARSGRSEDAKQALENFEKLKPKPKTPPGQ